MTACLKSNKSIEIKKSEIKKSSSGFTLLLAGNPNCGKTTVFNGLTGSHQRIGNWPGVTVERKSGCFKESAVNFEVIDLPGLYSLTLAAQTTVAPDECIAVDAILNAAENCIVNVVDASNLERNLYLTMQLIEIGIPLVLALNMMDVAKARGIEINVPRLSQALGCPVVTLSANKGCGLAELKETVANIANKSAMKVTPPQPVEQTYATTLQQAITSLETKVTKLTAIRLLENDAKAFADASPDVLHEVATWQKLTAEKEGEDADILLADARYRRINDIVALCVKRLSPTKASKTAWIDRIVLNRVLGLPIFLAVMYALFFFAINIGGAFQDFFDISSQTIFVDGLDHVLTQLGVPVWLTVLLGNGVGKGINTTITFIPVIGAMFLFLAFLEDSGYMARAAFVVDRMMRALGLPGKAFVPMIVGFGCNVPAVMGARTLENKHDRILTIMMAPFMSCGARLAIFAVFTAAFFPQGGQNIVFLLYLIGIAMAVLTGFILRRTLLKGDLSPLVMELPDYHLPNLKTLLLHAWQRLKGFVVRAGRLIVPICVLIGALNSFNLNGTMNTGEGDAQSLLSFIGQWVTPIFAPMGIHADNWPATVGLVTGVLAKEVVIGTLNTLYSQIGHLTAANPTDFHLWAGLKEACQSIPANFLALRDALVNPVLAKAPIDPVDQGVLGVMYQKFDGRVGAFAYLLFVLLYFPCISTTAVMLKELNRGWAVFSMLWMTGVAYATAVIFYQSATWIAHPLSSTLWVLAMLSAFFGTIFAIREMTRRETKSQCSLEGVKNTCTMQ